VRELLFARLPDRDVRKLGELWERAVPGAVSSPAWPPLQ
jgi:hypothetical protein